MTINFGLSSFLDFDEHNQIWENISIIFFHKTIFPHTPSLFSSSALLLSVSSPSSFFSCSSRPFTLPTQSHSSSPSHSYHQHLIFSLFLLSVFSFSLSSTISSLLTSLCPSFSLPSPLPCFFSSFYLLFTPSPLSTSLALYVSLSLYLSLYVSLSHFLILKSKDSQHSSVHIFLSLSFCFCLFLSLFSSPPRIR